MVDRAVSLAKETQNGLDHEAEKWGVARTQELLRFGSYPSSLSLQSSQPSKLIVALRHTPSVAGQPRATSVTPGLAEAGLTRRMIAMDATSSRAHLNARLSFWRQETMGLIARMAAFWACEGCKAECHVTKETAPRQCTSCKSRRWNDRKIP